MSEMSGGLRPLIDRGDYDPVTYWAPSCKARGCDVRFSSSDFRFNVSHNGESKSWHIGYGPGGESEDIIQAVPDWLASFHQHEPTEYLPDEPIPINPLCP